MGSPRIKVRLKSKPFLEFLAKKNWSLQMFSRKSGISSPMLTQMLGGVRFPGPHMRANLQRLTRYEWDEIFEIVEEQGAANEVV